MECLRLLFDHLAWIEHLFLSGIRDSRKGEGVGGVRKSIHQRWLAKGSSGRDSVGRGQHTSNRVSGISIRTMHQSTTPSLSQTIWVSWASSQFVAYWPSTEPSIKRCTCVNKQKSRNRCIRSKMSEYHLDLWTWLNSVQMCTPTGSWCTSNNYITMCHRRLGSVWVPVSVRDKMLEWEPVPDRGFGPSRPTVEQPSRMRKKCCYGQRNLGSICGSFSPSPAHLSHITNINPFEDKVREVYFYKEVRSFVHWSRHYCWLCLCLYCVCIMDIQEVPQPPYSPDLGPCDFWLFPKLRGCRYETIEEMKEAVMKVIDTLTQEDYHVAFQKLFERYNKCITAGGDYIEGKQEFHVCTINKSVHTEKSGNLFNDHCTIIDDAKYMI